MSLNIIKNQTGYVNPAISILDTGWTISGKYAIHTSCNSGIIKALGSLGIQLGKPYVIKYTVDNYVSGTVQLKAGTASGVVRNANGEYEETITFVGNTTLSFFSDGALRISVLKFYDPANATSAATTISFHEGSNSWGAEYDIAPEQIIKFIDQFLIIVNGDLWLQESNSLYNNFCGVQYVSKITFIANDNPTVVKVFFSERIEANSRWFSPDKGDINIKPTEGKSLGMSSRLKKNNYKNYQGSFFADFLRNMDDPRFETELEALFKGAELRGRVMEITIQNEENTESILFEIDIKSATSNYSY